MTKSWDFYRNFIRNIPKKFSKISWEKFWRNSQESLKTKCRKSAQVTKLRYFPDSPTMVTFYEEFPRNFSRIISCNWFLGNSSQELVPKMRDFWGIIVLRNSWEFLWKFLRNSLDLDSIFYRFSVKFIKRNSFKKFLGISPEFHPKKFLRNACPEIPEIFLGFGHQVYGF